ncbi:hypothetical protein PGTUg99_030960 [Puccinia graminis f. sp. tritici]|uniref:Uncharacterized protein n=1 Tax=Puccinia graminis f. sp. tritici TaxID=56615 RepID=A0A5B0NJH1_PUCGR|nr:hypothetical protein PGTUg99_030960 [Puccinia graminis f. sp. tritici]
MISITYSICVTQMQSGDEGSLDITGGSDEGSLNKTGENNKRDHLVKQERCGMKEETLLGHRPGLNSLFEPDFESESRVVRNC